MLKKSTYKVISLSLAFLIFFTSVGLSIDIHFCKGEFKGVSVIGEAKSCHSVMKACPNHGTMKMNANEDEERDCCSNHTLEFDELDSDFNISQDLVFSDLELKFLTSFAYAFFMEDAPTHTEYKTFISPTPLLVRDIYVLNETYLI